MYHRGVLNTAEPQICLGLMARISALAWLWLGLESSTFSIFYFILSLFMSKLCFFCEFGVGKMIQYAPDVSSCYTVLCKC